MAVTLHHVYPLLHYFGRLFLLPQQRPGRAQWSSLLDGIGPYSQNNMEESLILALSGHCCLYDLIADSYHD